MIFFGKKGHDKKPSGSDRDSIDSTLTRENSNSSVSHNTSTTQTPPSTANSSTNSSHWGPDEIGKLLTQIETLKQEKEQQTQFYEQAFRDFKAPEGSKDALIKQLHGRIHLLEKEKDLLRKDLESANQNKEFLTQKITELSQRIDRPQRTSSRKPLVPESNPPSKSDSFLSVFGNSKTTIKKNSAPSTKQPINAKLQKQCNELVQAIDNINLPKVQELLDDIDEKTKPILTIASTNASEQIPLHAAVKVNNPNLVRIVLNAHTKWSIDVNLQDSFGWTALHACCYCSRGTDAEEDILRQLLEYSGIRVDVANTDDTTPLHYFCQRFQTPTCTVLGEKMLQLGPPNFVNRVNSINGEAAVHKAIFNERIRLLMVKLLVKHGANLNIPNIKSGETPLHYAVRLGRKDIIKVLLRSGADISIQNTITKQNSYELAKICAATPSMRTDGIYDIIKLLGQAVDLKEWLKKFGAEEHFHNFVKDEIYLDTLIKIENSRLDETFKTLGIEQIGVRIELVKAIPGLRDELQKREFEDKLNKASKTKTQLSSTQQDQVLNLKTKLHNATDWLIKHSDIEFTRELGTGTSGKVFKGLFKKEKVAIKVLKAVDDKSLKEFRKEFHVQSILRGDNIVHFYGACLDPKVCIVMDYCKRGTLFHVLNNIKNPIDWKRAFGFAIGMAKGLKTLHDWDPPVFHRDMKSLNLLIKKDWSVQLCDFGLARFYTEESKMTTMKKLCGTYAYLAPEVFLGNSFTERSDIFACGIILWEILFRTMNGRYRLPYMEYKLVDVQIPYQVAEKGIRPTNPTGSPKEYVELINHCLEQKETDRPSTDELLNRLIELEKIYDDNSEEWDSMRK